MALLPCRAMHAARSYPSDWLILAEAVATLGLLAWLAHRPGRTGAGLASPSRFELWLLHKSRRPRLFGFGAALAAFLMTAATFAVLGNPLPKITDEFAYLLAADTFSQGRLANPSHPAWASLDIFALQWPVYAAKYPPAQGFLLAAGQFLGHPAWGLCLSAALLTWAAARAFSAWMPARWAAIALGLVFLRVAVGSYWSQSFWGGGLGAAGAALALSGARRWLDTWRPVAALELGLGLLLLANSRPFEGALFSIPLLGWLAWSLRATWSSRALPGFLLLSLLGLGGLTFMAKFNHAVTGDPWLFPHFAYARAYGAPSEWIFAQRSTSFTGEQSFAPDAIDSVVLQPMSMWIMQAGHQTLVNLARSASFFLGFLPAIGLLGWLWPGRRREAGHRGLGVLTSAVLVVALGNGLALFYFPHYAAPMLMPLVILAVAGWRRLLASRRWSRARFAWALLVQQLVLLALQLPAQRPDADDWSVRREEIRRCLDDMSGKKLVIVDGNSDWVANGADLENSSIVWARSRSEDLDRALLAAFPERRVFFVDARVEKPWVVPRRSTRGSQVLLEGPGADQRAVDLAHPQLPVEDEGKRN
jgi:hypothetical protein